MKYLLDTNILSELMKETPDYNTICWLQDYSSEVGTSAISIYELYYGVMLLPEGKRKTAFRTHIDALVKDLANRTLSYDAFCGYICASLQATVHKHGYTIGIADLMIAAIAQNNNCIVATRNIKDFGRIGVEAVNPFEYVPPEEARNN